jgi:hypothetical protein
MQINNKCRLQRFQKIGESQSKIVRGYSKLITQIRYCLFETCWENDQDQQQVNFSKNVRTREKNSYRHLQRVHKNNAKFGECQPKGVRLIDHLLFYVPLKNILLIWRRRHYRWRAAKFRLMLGTQGLWAGRDHYRATPTATRDLGLSGLIWKTYPFSRLLRHAWGCGGPILTRILTGKRS